MFIEGRSTSVILLISILCLLSSSKGPSETKLTATPFELNPPWYFPEFDIPDDNPMTEEGVQLGRMLFYEPMLSKNKTMSCASCHQQEKAFTDGCKVSLGVGGESIGRNAMSLSNLLWVRHFNWDGRAKNLESQVIEPIQHPLELNQNLDTVAAELQATPSYPKQFKAAFGSELITKNNMAKAIAQFLRTLISDNSKLDRYWRKEYELTEQEQRGMDLFYTHPEPTIALRGGNCGDCHLGALTAGTNQGMEGFHNNGLDTDQHLEEGLFLVTKASGDRGKFRTPSLRNIVLTAPYMHDGRFATLEEVLAHYDEHIQMSKTLDPLILAASNQISDRVEGVKLRLEPEEKEAILAFLRMLTDSTFITNEKFSNPFH